jgi:hypothetical protein
MPPPRYRGYCRAGAIGSASAQAQAHGMDFGIKGARRIGEAVTDVYVLPR